MGEEKILRGEEIVLIRHKPVVERAQTFGTFGNHHYVGPVNATVRLTESTVRQHTVFIYRVVVFGNEDSDRGLDVAMLEAVVEHYKVDAAR